MTPATRCASAWATSGCEALDEIIRLCGRLPLAMSIVAARVATHPDVPLRGFLAQLRAATPALDAFSGDEPEWDLRTVCSWSYDRLSRPGARLFRLLSAHPGPDIGRGCIAGLAGIEPRQAGWLVSELLLTGLLTEHRPGRYLFHDLVRLYAAEMAAADPDERAAAVTRLLSHLQLTAQAADELLMPPLGTRTVEAPVEGVVPERIVDLAAAVAWFGAELAVLERMVQTVRADGFPPWQLANTTVAYCQRMGAFRAWAALASAALAAAVDAGDLRGEAYMRRMLAGPEMFTGDTAASIRGLDRALALFRQLGAHVEEGHALRNLGYAYFLEHRYEQALDHYRRAEAVLARHGGSRGQALALTGIGISLAALEKHVEAIENLRLAGRIFARVQDHNWQGSCEDFLANIESARGDVQESIRHRRNALRHFAAAANPAGRVESAVALGRSLLTAGQEAEARLTLAEAAVTAEALNLTRFSNEIAQILTGSAGCRS